MEDATLLEPAPARSSTYARDRRERISRSIRAAVAIAFLAWAAFYLVTALLAIDNFAWRQPMFDQWRMYPTLLEPFPMNVLELENGHRPIVPNLIRVAEIKWFSADQRLQIGIGIGSAIASVFLVGLVAWRERTLPFLSRAAAAMIAVLGIFWLANSRMLMHGHEALHAYLLVLCVVVAALSTYRAFERHAMRWMLAASACCVVAMFCFGPGVACFPAVIALGILLRIPYRKLAIPAAVLIGCLIVYLYALPGNGDVRGALDVKPWTSLRYAMTWLSSPWATGWLSLADPPLYPNVAQAFRSGRIGSLLEISANATTTATHLPWQTLSMLIGFAGAAVFALRILYIFIKRSTLSRLQALAVMLCLFGLATALVIGIGRSDYFAACPTQLYADRYLMWPCLFWSGFALLMLVDAQASKKRWPLVLYCGLLLALPIALLPTHANTAGWAATVYRNGQRLAAAARSGVVDPQAILGNADSVEQYRDTAALLREHDLAMFADTSWQLLDSRWSGSLERNADIAVDVHPMTRVDVPDAGAAAGRVDGVVTRGIGELPSGGKLMLLDDADRIAGFAEFSFEGSDSRALMLSTPPKRGFDGYVSVLDRDSRYRLAWLDPATNRGLVLAEIPR